MESYKQKRKEERDNEEMKKLKKQKEKDGGERKTEWVLERERGGNKFLFLFGFVLSILAKEVKLCVKNNL